MKEREKALQQSIREREARMEQAVREAEEQLALRDLERLALLHQQHQHQQQQQQQHRSAELYQNPFASHERLINPNDFYQQQQQITTHRAPSPTSPSVKNDTASTVPIVAAVVGTAAVAASAAALTSSASASSEVDPRPANAILRHDLSSNHQLNVNPFEDPSSLLFDHENDSSTSSGRSSIHGNGLRHSTADDDDQFEDAEDDRSVTIGSRSPDVQPVGGDEGEDEEELDWTEAEIGSIGSSHDSEDSWGSP